MSAADAMGPGRTPLPALTGLRFFAASLVVYSHFGWAIPAALATVPLLGPIAERVAPVGYLGVSLFYLLSGFILAYTYLGPDGDGRGGMRGTVRAFYVARVARIYPAYLLGLVLALGAAAAWRAGAYAEPQFAQLAAQHPGGILFSTLALLQAWVPWWGDVLNPPATTLSCEALFYAAFPFFAPALARLSTGRLALTTALLYALEVAPAALWGGIVPANTHWLLWYNPLGRLPEFASGVCLGLLFLRHRRALGSLCWRPAPLLAAAGLLGTLGALLVARSLPLDMAIRGACDPAFCALLYGLAWSRGPIARALSRPTLLVLGEASYALYILHYPLWHWLVPVAASAPVGLTGVLFFAAYGALCIGFAVLTLRLVETPARSWLRRLLGGRTVGQKRLAPTLSVELDHREVDAAVTTGAA